MQQALAAIFYQTSHMTILQPSTSIRPIQLQDEAHWRTLWNDYTRFYERDPVEAITGHLWQRIFDPASPVQAIVAVQTDAQGQQNVIGIAHYLPHDNTSELTPVCYLQDLFVDPAARAGGVGGVGKQLIDWLLAEVKQRGWANLYWNTRETNYRARALYDKYTPQSGFVRYAVKSRV